jgi:cell wall assembly regulator SMI1
MPTLLETLKNAAGKTLINEDGIKEELTLLPPLNAEEFQALESDIPCRVPDEMRAFFAVTRGFEGGALETVDFSGSTDAGGFGLEEIFPHAIPIAHDGFGNYWVLDLTSTSDQWGPIFYACHDAPVIVFQTHSPAHFAQEAMRFYNSPWESEIDDVHGGLATRIWRENPGVLSFEECANSKNEDLRTFARSLDASYEFIDLRNPKLGDGFSWGRHGARTVNKRFGEKRIFAYQKKTKWERFRQFWKPR